MDPETPKASRGNPAAPARSVTRSRVSRSSASAGLATISASRRSGM